MPIIILTRGIQGSGKTTWAKNWVEEAPTHRVRWNNDEYRKMLGPYWIPEREVLVSVGLSDFLDKAMLFGYDIVIDNMNLNQKHWDFVQNRICSFNNENALRKLEESYTLEFRDFLDISLEECIKRDSKRDTPIGEKVITETYNKYRDIIEKLKQLS